MMLSRFLVTFLSLAAAAGAVLLPVHSSPQNNSELLTPTIIHQFDPVHWLENLYARSNGQLLINSQSAPELYLLDPAYPDQKNLVYNFPNTNPGLTGLGGIVETTPDTFAIIVGDLNHTTVTGSQGSFSIWTINLEGYPEKKPQVKKVISLPDATFLNGLTRLDDPTVILACDSYDGRVYRVDTITGDLAIVMQPDNTTTSPPGERFFIGIDGIRVYRPGNSFTTYLYYNNYVGEGYYRVPIHAVLGTPIGPVEVLGTSLGLGLDDLDIDMYGASWISAGQVSRIVRVSPKGSVSIVAESPDVMYVTAVRQGRTCHDASKLYFCTGLGKVGFIDIW